MLPLLRAGAGPGLVHCKGYGPWRRLVNAAPIFLAVLMAGSVPALAADPPRLLVLGDSLTAGYGLDQADGFVPRLEAALRTQGRAVRVLNGGVSGDTTAGGLSRLDWALADRPQAMIVELGANDGLRGLDPAATERNLDAIIAKAKTVGLPVLLAGMLAPPNLGRDYGREFNALYPRLAERHGVLFYPFFLEGVAARPHLNQADGIHPNPAGVAEIVRRILPDVMRLLDQVEAADGETRKDGS